MLGTKVDANTKWVTTLQLGDDRQHSPAQTLLTTEAWSEQSCSPPAGTKSTGMNANHLRPPHDSIMSHGPPFVLSTGHSFESVGDLLAALEAAFEVNEHLQTRVEDCTRELEDTKKELVGFKQRCHQLSDLVRTERSQLNPDDPPAKYVNIMSNMHQLGGVVQDATAAAMGVECLSQEHEGNWRDPEVQDMYTAIVKKGQSQGWLIRPQEVSLGEVVGAGSFGTTRVGEWRGAKVAIKNSGVPDTAADAINFLREVDAFACLKHPNILPFVGAVLKTDGQCWLVTEFMECGTLKEWLYGKNPQRPPVIPLSQRLEMALQIAQGMSALEALDPPICHRDLKPSNVFLNVGNRCCIADMNLARRLSVDSYSNLTGETGTYLYMSPEMMRHEPYTTKTDVFSFGVTLVELCNQRLPYSSLYLTPLQVAMGVTEGLRPPVLNPNSLPHPLRTLIDLCLTEDPFSRPNFVNITPQLRHIIAGVKQQEAAIISTSVGTLFGRMSGFLNTQQQQRVNELSRKASQGRDSVFAGFGGLMNRR